MPREIDWDEKMVAMPGSHFRGVYFYHAIAYSRGASSCPCATPTGGSQLLGLHGVYVSQTFPGSGKIAPLTPETNHPVSYASLTGCLGVVG